MKATRMRTGRGGTALALAILAVIGAGCSTSQERRSRYIEAGRRKAASKEYARAILEFRNAVRLDPKDTVAPYELAKAYLAAGQMANAVKSLQSVLALDPHHAAAQLELARLMVTFGTPEAVEEGRRQALELAGSSSNEALEALFTAGLAELKGGKPEDALEHFEGVLARSPSHIRAAAAAAAAKLRLKDGSAAEAIMERLAAGLPESAEAAVLLGEVRALNNKQDRAEVEFERALRLDPKNTVALVHLVRLRYSRGDMDGTEKLARTLSAADPNFRLAYAAFLGRTGRTDAAAREAQRLLAADPKDRKARSFLVALYTGVGRDDAAMQLLNASVAENRRDIEGLLQRGYIFLRSGQADKAEADITRVLRSSPGSAAAHYLMAGIHAQRGNRALVKQELAEALKADPAHLRARLDLARALILDGAPQAALNIVDEAPSSQRRQMPLLAQRNWCYLALKRDEEARAGIAAALEIGRAPELLLQKGILEGRKKETSPVAIGLLETYLRTAPEDVRAIQAIAGVYAMRNQMDAGLQYIGAHAAAHPGSAALQAAYGRLCLTNGRLPEARLAFERAKAAAPQSAEPELKLAEIDILAQRPGDAQGRLRALLKRSPKLMEAQYLLGEAALAGGDPFGAIQAYRSVIEADGNNVPALNNLASLLADYERQYDEAMQLARRAVEMRPDFVAAQDTLGWVYFRKGLYGDAVRHLQVAVEREPTGLRKYHLAMAYLRSGNTQRGLTMYQEAVALDSKLPKKLDAQ